MILPEINSTMDERTMALETARPLLSNTTPFTSSAAGVLELIRLAEYITTGHDYLDSHAHRAQDEQ